MDATSKYQIVERIIQSNDDNLLNQIRDLLSLQDKDFWDDLPVEVKQAISKAENELDNGEGIAHPQIMAELNDRFLNK